MCLHYNLRQICEISHFYDMGSQESIFSRSNMIRAICGEISTSVQRIVDGSWANQGKEKL